MRHLIGQSVEFDEKLKPKQLREQLNTAETLPQAEAALLLANGVFGSRFDNVFQEHADPSSDEWRLKLGNELLRQSDTQAILDSIYEHNGPIAIERLTELIAVKRRYRQLNSDDITAIVEAVVSLISYARAGRVGQLRPFLGVRVQVWVRELARMVAILPNCSNDEALSPARLEYSDDLSNNDSPRSLPIVTCVGCGVAGLFTKYAEGNRGFVFDLRQLYSAFFEDSHNACILYSEPMRGDKAAATCRPAGLNLQTLERTDPNDINTAQIWIYTPPLKKNRQPRRLNPFDTTCPFCKSHSGLQIVGIRAQRQNSNFINTLFCSKQNEPNDTDKPRLLMFSDSVQDAAQRSSVTEIRNVASVRRKVLLDEIKAEGRISLEQAITNLPIKLRKALGDKAFIAKFIPTEMKWRDAYKSLEHGESNPASSTSRLAGHVQLRLGWDFYAELTYRLGLSESLISTRLIAVEADPDKVAAAVMTFKRKLRMLDSVKKSMLRDNADISAFLAGFIDKLRRNGSVNVGYLRQVLINSCSKKGFNHFAVQRTMGIYQQSVLPTLGKNTARPSPLTISTPVDGFDFANSNSPTNWYYNWVDKHLLQGNELAFNLNQQIVSETLHALEIADLVIKVKSNKDHILSTWLLNPAHIIISSNCVELRCSDCGFTDTGINTGHGSTTPRSCIRVGCSGTMVPSPSSSANEQIAKLYSLPRAHRVVAEEHTGLREADVRKQIEDDFITREDPWHINLISATPTLELGVDIGSLSTLTLSSIPPEPANYVQRVGRTGRRDGNSLILALANARPHDLQFWEEPNPMLFGSVAAPGLFLAATAVLRRQFAAYTLDRLVAEVESEIRYGDIRSLIDEIRGKGTSSFLTQWFNYLDYHGDILVGEFLRLLPDKERRNPKVVADLQLQVSSDQQYSLRARVKSIIEDAKGECDQLNHELKAARNKRKELNKQQLPSADAEEKLRSLIVEINEMVRAVNRINKKQHVLQFLTDNGILPNYSFPEEGVKLTVQVSMKSAYNSTNQPQYDITKYSRPAATALTELAPFQTFYAEGREVEVNAMHPTNMEVEEWKFCGKCSHSAPSTNADEDCCPKCGDAMWSDRGKGGGTVPVILQKSVIARKPAHKASIRERDDRAIERFSRMLFPHYSREESEGIIAYAVGDENQASQDQFGFEFIPSCEFRDVNFGHSKISGTPRTIAGNEFCVNEFLMCRRCGTLLNENHRDCGNPTCGLVMAEEVNSQRFALMRIFTTEALRLVIPISGQSDSLDNMIKSFSAAFDLGMRKTFEGRISHLRAEIVCEFGLAVGRMYNVYVYDTVPGGTSYLQEIAEDISKLRKVFERARDHLNTCPCQHDDKDGCYRCVKTYRSLFGKGAPSRSTGLSLVERVLSCWSQLKKVNTPIDTILKPGIEQSALETRFIDSLHAAFPGALKPTISADTIGAQQLQIMDAEGNQAFWKVEPQVEIHLRFPGVPEKRVDFLITPLGKQNAKPIVVELDGWKYHAGEVADDLRTRLLLLRSGRADIITLTWHDLMESENNSASFNPFALSRLDAAECNRVTNSLDIIESKYQNGKAAKSDIECIVQHENSRAGWNMLRDRLMGKQSGALGPCLLLFLLCFQRKKPISEIVVGEELTEVEKDFFDTTPFVKLIQGERLNIYLGSPTEDPWAVPNCTDDFRILVKAHLPSGTDAEAQEDKYLEPWRNLWRIVTQFQHLRGLHVSHPDLTDLDPPVIADLDSVEWEGIYELTEGAARTLAHGLWRAGINPPEIFGEGILVGETVTEPMEFVWSAQRVAVGYSDIELTGWTVFTIDETELMEGIIDEVITAIQKAESEAATNG